MKKKTYATLSLSTLLLGAIIGGYALLRIFIFQVTLRAGTCPVTNYRPFLYIGIALCLLSFVFSFLEHRAKNSEDDSYSNK